MKTLFKCVLFLVLGSAAVVVLSVLGFLWWLIVVSNT